LFCEELISTNLGRIKAKHICGKVKNAQLSKLPTGDLKYIYKKIDKNKNEVATILRSKNWVIFSGNITIKKP
jgi:hypothetical protein